MRRAMMLPIWLAAMLGLVVLTSPFASAQEGNKSADLHGAGFTTGSVVSGQRYVGHPENVLPQPTKHFSKATDSGARLIIVLKNPNAHALAGVLKDSSDRVRQRMKVDLKSAAPGLAWRFTSYRFPSTRSNSRSMGPPSEPTPFSIVP
jgi:hypothetical protein